MKCIISDVRLFEVYDYRVMCSMSCFIPIDSIILPEKILKWIYNYNGIAADITGSGIKVKVKSSSKCDDQDDYDFKTGCFIAKSKAKRKVYTFIMHLCQKLYVYYNDMSEDFLDSKLKYEDSIEYQREITEEFY